jgi:hypothetical protein
MVLGIDPTLPIRSIRLADRVEESVTVVIHGVTLSNFVKRIKTVDEEVRTLGRAKLRLPSSVHIRKRRRQASTAYKPKAEGTRQKGKAAKVRKSIIVRVVSTRSLPPAFAAIRSEAIETALAPMPTRVLVSDDEFAVAEASWRRLRYGQWRCLDFEMVAEEIKLSLTRVHLISCALIAKGVIQQDGPGMYQQGWPNLVVKNKDKSLLEIDLRLTYDKQPEPSLA